ncbi:MAG: hypothetical protein PHU07_13190 [Acidocella sp.]|nr:hypothetical protein [Acidocella sp.]
MTTAAINRPRRKPGCGHTSKGRGCGPATGRGNGKPRQKLDTAPEKQRERVLKRWAAHRQRVAMGPHVVEEHARKLRFQKIAQELKREKRRIRDELPPRARSGA